MSTRNRFSAAALAALCALALGASTTAEKRSAEEPIVGLWLITASYQGTVVDNVFSGWTGDGLEFDQDTGSPMLTGYVCYGAWVKLGDHKYGLTHPYFDYNAGTITAPLPFNGAALGTWDGTSGYFNYVVTVSDDGKTFTGQENSMSAVPGPDPYVGTGASFTGVTLTAKKIEVNRSLLPEP